MKNQNVVDFKNKKHERFVARQLENLGNKTFYLYARLLMMYTYNKPKTPVLTGLA